MYQNLWHHHANLWVTRSFVIVEHVAAKLFCYIVCMCTRNFHTCQTVIVEIKSLQVCQIGPAFRETACTAFELLQHNGKS